MSLDSAIVILGELLLSVVIARIYILLFQVDADDKPTPIFTTDMIILSIAGVLVMTFHAELSHMVQDVLNSKIK